MAQRVVEVNAPEPLVLHVVQFLRGGGAETFVRELVPSLVQRGIDARVLCAYGPSQLTDEEARWWTGRLYCQQRSNVSRFRYLQEMRRIIRLVAPDIVHTHTQVGAFWGRTAALLENVPIVIHTEHRSKDPLPLLERAAHKILNPQTDVTITFSERTAELVRRREKVRNLCVIPNGIRIRPRPSTADRQIARRTLGVGSERQVGGMVGSLEVHKNPGLALEALALLPAPARATLTFAFFGDGCLRNDLEVHARKLGVHNLIQFYGFRPDIEDLLPGLDFVVSTSAREMMPVSLLESMNAALPIIGTPHSGTLDLVVDNETGIVLKSWSPQELAEAMQWVLAHSDWRLRAGEAARARLTKHFSMETVADQYAGLYRRLLRPSAAAPVVAPSL